VNELYAKRMQYAVISSKCITNTFVTISISFDSHSKKVTIGTTDLVYYSKKLICYHLEKVWEGSKTTASSKRFWTVLWNRATEKETCL
jgi:hypothetical protein